MNNTVPANECMQDIVHPQPDLHMTPTPSTTGRLVRRRPRTQRLRFLRQRELGGSAKAPRDLLTWIEGETLRKLDTGAYVELDKSPHLVRSTISIAFSHDGRYFASTHGDHSVKVFEYASRKKVCSLDGHPRTPWSVRFHPTDSSIVASGCLGGECRVWNIAQRKCIRKHTFRSLISCVAFSPSGEFLAVTCGRQLLLWNYAEPTADGCIFTRAPAANVPRDPTAHIHGSFAHHRAPPGMPFELLELEEDKSVFKLVDFHPSGHLLMTGESNRQLPTAPGVDEQFTLKLVVHQFDRRTGVSSGKPILTVPRAVAYNDAGIHFSPCGTMLAACVPVSEMSQDFHIAVLSLTNNPDGPIGTTLYSTPLDKGHVTALTNLKFSCTSQHLLAGFSFRPQNPVLRNHAEHYDAHAGITFRDRGARLPRFAACGTPMKPEHPQVCVVDIYRVCKSFPRIRSLGADMDITDNNIGGAEDEINVAVFAPAHGIADGILYGTQKGRIRMFQHATGRRAYPPGICDENCKFRNAHSVRTLLNPASPPPLRRSTAPVTVHLPPQTLLRYAAFPASDMYDPYAARSASAPMPQYGLRTSLESQIEARMTGITDEFRTQVINELRALQDSYRLRHDAAAGPSNAGGPTPAPPALPPIIFERHIQNRRRQDGI